MNNSEKTEFLNQHKSLLVNMHCSKNHLALKAHVAVLKKYGERYFQLFPESDNLNMSLFKGIFSTAILNAEINLAMPVPPSEPENDDDFYFDYDANWKHLYSLFEQYLDILQALLDLTNSLISDTPLYPKRRWEGSTASKQTSIASAYSLYRYVRIQQLYEYLQDHNLGIEYILDNNFFCREHIQRSSSEDLALDDEHIVDNFMNLGARL